MFALAERHYGSWKRGGPHPAVKPEPPQKGEKRVEVAWPNPTHPYLFIGYHAPAFSTDGVDVPALDLIGQLLFSEAAPLYQRLVVEEQVVDVLSGGAADHRDPYLFTTLARVKKPERLAYVEGEIGAALEDLQDRPVEAGRLETVKSHVRYAFAMSLSTADNVAQSLAHYLALTGDPESVNRLYALYERVTSADIQAAARRYFAAEGRTVVTLRAGGADTAEGGGPAAAGGGGR
jgi:zinc protease